MTPVFANNFRLAGTPLLLPAGYVGVVIIHPEPTSDECVYVLSEQGKS
jgi:hypothetical protein